MDSKKASGGGSAPQGSADWYQRSTTENEAERAKLAAAKRRAWETETRAIPRQSETSSAPKPAGKKVQQVPVKAGVWDQVGAGWRGAVDEGSLGSADLITAAMRSGNPLDPKWRGRFNQNQAIERSRDADDQKQFGAARNTGRIVGGVATLLVPVAGEVAAVRAAALAAKTALRAVPSLAKTAPALARLEPKVTRFIANANSAKRITPMVTKGAEVPIVLAAHAAGGAGVGVVGQELGDLVSTGRFSPIDALPEAAISGSASSLLGGAFGPRVGAGIVGSARSVYDTVQSGVPLLSWDGATNVLAGGLSSAGAAGQGDRAGRYGVQGMAPKAKGELGETLSKLKSTLQGERVDLHHTQDGRPTDHIRIKVPGGWTIADHTTDANTVVESKFGNHRDLSVRQRSAREMLGDLYRVDHWKPLDIGRVTGSLFGAFAQPLTYSQTTRRAEPKTR